MSVKKNILNTISLVIILSSFVLSAQVKDSITIGVIARPFKDSIKLRWTPTTPQLWTKANTIGYTITRFTLKRDGEFLNNPEERQLVAIPIKPLPLPAWENYAVQNGNAAILAQAIYGERFITSAPGSDVGTIMAINDENEQRFTFALLAAEQSYKASLMAGLAYTDTNVKANETYLYQIKITENLLETTKTYIGTALTGMVYHEPLPVPYGTIINFGDHEAKISWNYALLKRFYSRYVVERSEDGSNFTPLDNKPVFNSQTIGDDQNESLVYHDSIPNNKIYYYRIKGQTAFDENGPYSKILSGMAQPDPKFAPQVEKASFENDGVRIVWTFDEKEEKTIDGFELRRANADNETYKIVGNLMPVKTRETFVAKLQPTNYFKVVAIGKNGTERPSYAKLVQPIDSIPPNIPTELIAKVDTSGVVRITWKKNIEPDLLGYRVYKANNPKDEFGQETSVAIRDNNFNDTLKLNNLNKAIYYRVSAEDLRYNSSKLSTILKVNLPDKIAPSVPVIKKYDVLKNGVQVQWIPSSSKDVMKHSLYRKKINDSNEKWVEQYTTNNIIDSLYVDTESLETGKYSYTIIATDSTGLESKPATPIQITYTSIAPSEDQIKFTGSVDRELRYINLSWKIKKENIVSYRLYKGTSESNLKLYKTLSGDLKGYNDVNLEINSDYTYGLQLLLTGGRISPIKTIHLKY
jgi:hypothetical protein